MRSIISQEKKKRERAIELRRYSKINWNIRKVEILNVLNSIFKNFDIDGEKFIIDHGLNNEFFEEFYVGYDCVQVTHPMRFTGNQIITKTINSTKFDVKKEHGAALSITASSIGVFNVFLKPAECDERLIKRKDLLICTCNNPLYLTNNRIEKLVKSFLIFQRVDSLIERASLWERVYVKWLYFWDARNRDKYQSLLFQITNHWGAVAVSALATWIIAKNT